MRKQVKLWLSIFVVIVMLLGAFVFVKHTDKNKTAVSRRQNTTKKQKSDLPSGSRATDWQLILVNKQHQRKTKIPFTKVTVDTKQMDERIEKPLAEFRNAAQKAGYTTTLVSAYRSIAYQTQVYNQSIAQNEANGLSHDQAVKLTQTVIQTPGSSEHQTGLAVDLAGNDAVAKYPQLQAEMDEFASQKWLIKHAPQYGFILRYPSDKKSISETGIDYESWHFRYVGVKNAEYMTKHHLTLETYVKKLAKAHEK